MANSTLNYIAIYDTKSNSWSGLNQVSVCMI